METKEGSRDPEIGTVTVRITDRLYRIPVRYMYADGLERHSRWPTPKGGVVDLGAVNLSVLLPDLRPYSEADKAHWKVPGHGNRVELSIASSPGVDSNWIATLRDRDRRTKQTELQALVTNIDGLEQFARPTSIVYFPREPAPRLFIECDGAGSVRFPSCRVRSVIGPGLELSYVYSLQHLSNWQSIDDGLRQMVTRFNVVAQ